jgi:hypothetical protein
MLITSREYKLTLQHREFTAGTTAVEGFWQELKGLTETLEIATDGSLDTLEERSIQFLDTPDSSVRSNGLLLRRRIDKDKKEFQYTLKCRSPDRYLAAGTDVRGAQGFDFKEKFEEDITSPFSSRFSHSATVTVPAQGSADNKFKTVGDAAKMFPGLGDMRRDGMRCPLETALLPVNNLEVRERVFSGGDLLLDTEKAEAALIFWSIGQQKRLVVAEFSFRYKNKQEDYGRGSARAAMQLFQAVQRVDWFEPAGATKTEFLYGDTA